MTEVIQCGAVYIYQEIDIKYELKKSLGRSHKIFLLNYDQNVLGITFYKL